MEARSGLVTAGTRRLQPRAPLGAPESCPSGEGPSSGPWTPGPSAQPHWGGAVSPAAAPRLARGDPDHLARASGLPRAGSQSRGTRKVPPSAWLAGVHGPVVPQPPLTGSFPNLLLRAFPPAVSSAWHLPPGRPSGARGHPLSCRAELPGPLLGARPTGDPWSTAAGTSRPAATRAPASAPSSRGFSVSVCPTSPAAFSYEDTRHWVGGRPDPGRPHPRVLSSYIRKGPRSALTGRLRPEPPAAPGPGPLCTMGVAVLA